MLASYPGSFPHSLRGNEPGYKAKWTLHHLYICFDTGLLQSIVSSLLLDSMKSMINTQSYLVQLVHLCHWKICCTLYQSFLCFYYSFQGGGGWHLGMSMDEHSLDLCHHIPDHKAEENPPGDQLLLKIPKFLESYPQRFECQHILQVATVRESIWLKTDISFRASMPNNKTAVRKPFLQNHKKVFWT